jgi:hypothetical protein
MAEAKIGFMSRGLQTGENAKAQKASRPQEKINYF